MTDVGQEPMSDRAARDEALNIAQSFIVQAPAGSGKTTLLIGRFMCLLAVAEQPEEVLAITFTRKATAEMRERIHNALKPDSPLFPQESVNRAVSKVRARSLERGWNLLELPSRLQIMTIDALCTSLVRRMPWASRFGSLPEIVEDAARHYRSAVLNLYESADQSEALSGALAVLLQHLDNNSGKLQELIVQLLHKRDQWLRHLVGTSFTDADRELLQKIWQVFIAAQLDKTRDMMPSPACEKLGLDRLDHSQPSSVAEWKQLAAGMITASRPQQWRKRITAADVPSSLTKEEFQEVIDMCRDNEMLKNRLVDVRETYPNSTAYEDSQWQALQACSVVLQHAVAELKLEFRKYGQVDFIEMAQQSLQALGDADNPTDLSLVLDYQYRHIMVDEFQDTSVSQRDLLEMLVAGWQAGDGRTLFLVGDPMQSIYRFREAEVGIYLSVVENGLADLPIKPLRLTRNFRSERKLVEWFNSIFEPSFPHGAEIESGSVPYVKCTTELEMAAPRQEGTVSLWLQQNKNQEGRTIPAALLKQKEADQIIEDLMRFRAQNSGADVQAAVLVENRRHADLIIERLVEREISFYAQDFIPLSERPVVEDILSLTRCLLNLADRTSWMAVLRAPWCGLTLADLLVIAEDREAAIWDRLNDSQVEMALSEDGRLRVERVRGVLHRTFAAAGQHRMREWVQDCWLLLGGPACYAPHDLDNAQLILDLIEQNAKGHSVENLSLFEEKLARLHAVPVVRPDETWLHVLTMHGAKGLEFDAVFLPQFSAYRRGRASNPLLVWSEFVREGWGSQMLLSPIVATGSDKQGSQYDFILKWEKKRTKIELLRLAYVACTRAKRELYIYGHGYLNVVPPEYSMLGLTWPGMAAEIKADAKWIKSISSASCDEQEELEEQSAETKEFALMRLPSDWRLPDPPESVKVSGYKLESPDLTEPIDFDWAGSVALWIGNVVHEWLEKIVRTGAGSWNADQFVKEKDKWRNRLLAMGMTADDEQMEFALERIRTALVNVLNDPTGQWILSDQHQDSDAELRLTGFVKGEIFNVIVDRTFVDQNGVRWIIDYKSGTTGGNVEQFLAQEVGRYRDQLMRYRSIVSGMDSRPIRTALYFPMFPAWREVT